jgi:hypothetical protein
MSERPLPPARRETEDVAPRIVAMLGLAALGMLVFAVIATLWLFSASVKDRSMAGSVPVFPAPSLQASPRSDMAAFGVKQRHELESYGWIESTERVASRMCRSSRQCRNSPPMAFRAGRLRR